MPDASGSGEVGRCCPIRENSGLVGDCLTIRYACLFQSNPPTGLQKQFRIEVVDQVPARRHCRRRGFRFRMPKVAQASRKRVIT